MVALRFIPAYAGNAILFTKAFNHQPVHPRIRGERIAISRNSLIQAGSSPHTRGTLISFEGNTRNIRFIPAYAGNAGWEKHTDPMRTVHPRIRGERGCALVCADFAAGSSPHTRGTPRPQFLPMFCITVHPRIRGERSAMMIITYR